MKYCCNSFFVSFVLLTSLLLSFAGQDNGAGQTPTPRHAPDDGAQFKGEAGAGQVQGAASISVRADRHRERGDRETAE